MFIPVFASLLALSGIYLIFWNKQSGSGVVGVIALIFTVLILLLPVYTEPGDIAYTEKVAQAGCKLSYRLGGPHCT